MYVIGLKEWHHVQTAIQVMISTHLNYTQIVAILTSCERKDKDQDLYALEPTYLVIFLWRNFAIYIYRLFSGWLTSCIL